MYKRQGFKLDKDLVDYYESYIKYYNANNKLNSSNSNRPLLGSAKLAEIPVGSAAIKRQAKNNDVAVITIGRNAGEGADRKMMDDFELTAVERELIQNVSSAFHLEGKKVVVVLNIGGVIETNSWKDMVDAILLPWSPGQEGANAVADVLTGKANPSGKLPMTCPVNFTDHPSSANFPYDYTRPQNNSFFRGPAQPVKDVDYTDYEEGIYVGYRHFTTSGTKVSYPFGYGLYYTDFAYSKPVVKAGTDGFTATVTVTNTGSVAGKEVVELYVSAPAGGMDKPKLELKAFAKTRELQPGESQTLTLSVDNYSLASFNEANSSWETAAGSYKVFFSKNVDAPQCSGEYKLKKAQSWKVNTIFE